MSRIYVQKCGKFGETWLHEWLHELVHDALQNPLLHLWTARLRSREGTPRKWEKKRRPIRTGQNVNQAPLRITDQQRGGRGGRECVDRGRGENLLPRRRKKTTSHTVLCNGRSSQNTQIAPGSEREGIVRTRKQTTQKPDRPMPQLSGPTTQTTARH